jgi:hypothetical protein
MLGPAEKKSIYSLVIKHVLQNDVRAWVIYRYEFVVERVCPVVLAYHTDNSFKVM